MTLNKTQDAITLVLGSDQGYFDGLWVTLSSLFLHTTSKRHLKIYIFDGGIEEVSKCQLEKDLKKLQTNFSITYLVPDLKQFESFLPMGSSYMAYARLLIPALIPEKKAIWLDVDLLLLIDIELLWVVELNEFPVGAILDTAITKIVEDVNNYKAFGISHNSKYFNTGVLLMNKDALLKMDFMKKCFDFLETNIGHYKFYDQSAINVVCNNNIKVLDSKFNRLSTSSSTVREDICLLKNGGYIYHFILRAKPWIRYSNSAHSQYIKYLGKLSSFQFSRMHSLSNRLVKLKHKIPHTYRFIQKIVSLVLNRDKNKKESLECHIVEIITEKQELKRFKKGMNLIFMDLEKKYLEKTFANRD